MSNSSHFDSTKRRLPDHQLYRLQLALCTRPLYMIWSYQPLSTTSNLDSRALPLLDQLLHRFQLWSSLQAPTTLTTVTPSASIDPIRHSMQHWSNVQQPATSQAFRCILPNKGLYFKIFSSLISHLPRTVSIIIFTYFFEQFRPQSHNHMS